MKNYQIIDMPKPGKEQGIAAVVPVFQVMGGIANLEIPYHCNIEKVIIYYGDLYETQKVYEKLEKKIKK